jgi:hypothetical protein
MCYRVCPCPPIHLIGSAYYQQYRIMEQEHEPQLIDYYHLTNIDKPYVTFRYLCFSTCMMVTLSTLLCMAIDPTRISFALQCITVA